ncbi:MAG: O-antigen ligase family protein [Acidobacteria bacterium]|nr:O-antigen ligase family protein [Acidobacteriota bacterium]
MSPARAGIVDALVGINGPVRFASLSNAPGETLRAFSQLAGVVLTFVLVRRLLARTEDRKWIVVLPPIAVALGQGVLGIVQASTQDVPGTVSGSYANRNHFAGLLEMAMPLAVLLAVYSWRSNEDRFKTPLRTALAACLLLGAAAVMLIAILLSLSRMGFLAALTALFVIGILSLNRGQVVWTRWLPAAGLALIVAGLFVFLPSDQLIARFAGLATTNEISADDRLRIWKDTLALIRAYPVFGCGAWAFEPSFFRYQTAGTLNLVNFAHNDYLQGVAELGLLGFSLVLAAVAAAFANALAGSTAARGAFERYLSIACAGSLFAIALHSIVDFNLYVPANAMLVGWIFGLASLTPASWGLRPRRAGASFELFAMHSKRPGKSKAKDGS